MRIKRLIRLALVQVFFLCLVPVLEVGAASEPAAKIVNLQGEVAVRRSGAQEWVAARIGEDLFSGDALKTGPSSRAAILCVDESQIKLNENTVLVLKRVAPSPRLLQKGYAPAALKEPPASIYQVPLGEIWLRNSNEKFRFELETPAVTANIRGTEFNVRVKPDGTTNVTLLEGSLCLVNPQGELCLRPGEEGLAIPGQAPSKRVLLQPADAVQWTLYYPGVISYRDLPLTGSPAAGVAAYNQGRLKEAQQEAEAVLRADPENGGALTLLGWVSLQQQAPEEALGYFKRVRQPDERTVIGLALATYRLGNIVGAFELANSSLQRIGPTPQLLTMTGYFALMSGKVNEARGALQEAVRQAPAAAVMAHALLAQIDLAQNRKPEAQSQAAQALSLGPNSPMALVSMALVRMASFDLPAAIQNLQQALAADPRLVDAYVYLTKIYLGSDYLARARKTIQQALQLAPKDGVVLSQAGFVRLAYRDYRESQDFFTRAVKADPRLGEPHIGLAIYHFRYRDYQQGLAEMLAATLLDPRLSLYQSELGKALYQVRAFDKALETYDYASKLDPRDPTPHLYKGIALTDLNRPGEAVQAINRSIELNDNTAIFRSRIMLDRDLAVRNYDLARAYNQLGLGEWAYSKAVTAVQNDPTNSSAHLFLTNSYATLPQGMAARNAEWLLYRVLAPANQNTFSSLIHDDYTPMFELPYYRVAVQGGIGAWQESKSKLAQDDFVNIYGGLPALGFYTQTAFQDDRGFRRNAQDKLFNSELALKYEPTVNGCFSALFQYRDGLQGDLTALNDFNFVNLKDFRFNWRHRIMELSYVHRFNPQSTLLTYFTYQTLGRHVDAAYPFPPITVQDSTRSDFEFFDVQIQKQVIVGKHTLIGGFDYFNGHLKFNALDQFWGGGFMGEQALTVFRPPERTYSFYLLDYWKLTPRLLIELGVFKDFSKNSRDWFAAPITNSMWSPRFGVNFQINNQHMLRAAVARHLNTHLFLQPLLVPTEIASFPWVTTVQNVLGGAEVRQAGFAWEAQWNAKTFSTLRLEANRVDIPDLENTPDFDIKGQLTRMGWKQYQASWTLNRILTPALGLTAGVVGKRVIPDPNPVFLEPIFNIPFRDFSELRGFLGFSYLNSRGWQGSIKPFLVKQYLKDRASNPFGLVNFSFGKEFDNKRGKAILEVNNLFNRHFYQALEPAVNPEFFPARRIIFKLALYF